MSEINHTPAPWKVEITGRFMPEDPMICVIAGNYDDEGYGDNIAAVTTRYSNSDADIPEWRTNAAMMAAAPEMLNLIERLSQIGRETDIENMAIEAAMLLSRIESHTK